MESKGKAYLVEPHRKPRRKVRRRPLRMREIGVDVARGGGLFVMPLEAYRSTPMVVALCDFTVDIYNEIADVMLHKAAVDANMEAATGETLANLQKTSANDKKFIQTLRGYGHLYRKFVVDVEGGRPVNEPLVWERE